MVQIVREFIVREEALDQFRLAYGPGGAWSRLVSKRPGFRGTTLLRDTVNPHRYLTIDFWDTEDQWEQTLAVCRTEYANIDAAFAEWTEAETKVGTFRVLVEATVRARSRARRGKASQARRRSTRTTC